MDAAITAFDVMTPAGEKYLVVVGNMHIVCASRPPSNRQRQLAVQRLAERLLTYVSAHEIPVVRVIVGDNNLTSFQVKVALQQVNDTDPLWRVYATTADCKGDHVAVQGATARFEDIAVGVSYEDRGMCRDCHDAAAVVITLPEVPQSAPKNYPREDEKKPDAEKDEQKMTESPELKGLPGSKIPRRFSACGRSRGFLQ